MNNILRMYVDNILKKSTILNNIINTWNRFCNGCNVLRQDRDSDSALRSKPPIYWLLLTDYIKIELGPLAWESKPLPLFHCHHLLHRNTRSTQTVNASDNCTNIAKATVTDIVIEQAIKNWNTNENNILNI